MVKKGRGRPPGARGVKSWRGSSTNIHGPYTQSENDNGSSHTHFSLSEEARHTERRHLSNSDLRLRHAHVAFVSAGAPRPEELINPQEKDKEDLEVRPRKKETNGEARDAFNEPAFTPEVPMSQMSLDDGPTAGALKANVSGKFGVNGQLTVQEPRPGKSEPDTRNSNAIFFTDTKGSMEPLHTGLSQPPIRLSLSPVPSVESDEIIVFQGKKRAERDIRTAASKAPNFSKVNEDYELGQSYSLEPLRQFAVTVVDDPTESNHNELSLVQQPTAPNHEKPVFRTTGGLRMQDLRSGEMAKSTRKPRRERDRHRQRQKDEETQILADYIANVNNSGDLDSFAQSFGLNPRELGGSDNVEGEDDERVSRSEHRERATLRDVSGWDNADLDDFDQISTASESVDSIGQVILKRERPSGSQYLVVGQGQEVDYARWLPSDECDTPAAKEKLRGFKEKEVEYDRFREGSANSEDSIAFEKRLALAVEKDGVGLEENRGARMTDKQMARLLSKQEELGFGSDNVQLFDGAAFDDREESEAQLDGVWEGVEKSRHQSQPKRRKHAPSDLPFTAALGDVLERDSYFGFDVIDQDRPSLRKIPQARRGSLPIELSDSELELQIQMAWENDRCKKKKYKQEREELRAQGLLGKKGKPNLKVKYTEGISMVEIKDEIKDFLLSSMNSLALPPMAQRERKIVHEIANIFKLKSKSIGSGTSRFPILHRTSRSNMYDEDALGTIEALLSSRRFLPRIAKGKKKGTSLAKAHGGGFAKAGVSYRNGEIVGATAPELGQENKGRAMLERMGWSTGTTLGALNNSRGIVQPVAQVVKTGKAGLG